MLAVGIGPIGPIEGLIILAVVVLIFGVGKLSDVGGALGKSIREFRRAAREPDEPEQIAASHCTNCGNELRGEEKFCAKCGTPVAAAGVS
jgi:sec-independent protein translocase protein TatA